MDVTIKDVPETAVVEVKRMAAVAVERYLRRVVVPTKEVTDTFEKAVNDFRTANELEEKFATTAVVVPKVVVEEK